MVNKVSLLMAVTLPLALQLNAMHIHTSYYAAITHQPNTMQTTNFGKLSQDLLLMITNKSYASLMDTIKKLPLTTMQELFAKNSDNPIMRIALCIGSAKMYNTTIDPTFDATSFVGDINNWVRSQSSEPSRYAAKEFLHPLVLKFEGLSQYFSSQAFKERRKLWGLEKELILMLYTCTIEGQWFAEVDYDALEYAKLYNELDGNQVD